MTRLEMFGVVAGAIGCVSAGYGVGAHVAERGNQQIAQALGQGMRAQVPEGAQSRVLDRLEAGDLGGAAALLQDGVTLVESSPVWALGR